MYDWVVPPASQALKALSANSAGNDKVLFSVKVSKINRKGKSQNRVLLITSRHILNLMPDNYSKCNRCMQISQLHHLTTSATNQEFALHFADEYDYRFKSSLWEQAVNTLRDAYRNVTGTELAVSDFANVDALAQQVMTKVAVKQMGSSWGPNPLSMKARDEGPSAGGFAASPSSKFDADDVDSEGDDELRDLKSDSAREAADTSGTGRMVGGWGGGSLGKKTKFSMEDFTIIRVLGKGAFGKVMLVRCKDDNVIYAMKSLSKQQLLEKNEVTHTKTERKALESTHHPYLVHLRFAFQSPTKLYLVMDYCNGGELFFHLKQSGRFDEPRARLYASEILSAIHHLHKNKIIYRDLKPENVLLDSEGHVRITDFGLAKDAMDANDKTHTFCGTPDYLAPEIIKGAGHGRGVDWWSLGTMIYEMLGGLPPFYSENFNIMYERILHAPLEFKPAEIFKPAAREVITAMLQKEPSLRAGSGDADGDEVKAFEWFKPIDWALLDKRGIIPAFKPSVASETDTSYFDDEFTSQPLESMVPDAAIGGRQPKPTDFEGFTYVGANHLEIS